jgi:hypothetical protein
MGDRHAFDQLTLIQLNQPRLQLRAMEQTARVSLVQILLLEILSSGTADTCDEESDNE